MKIQKASSFLINLKYFAKNNEVRKTILLGPTPEWGHSPLCSKNIKHNHAYIVIIDIVTGKIFQFPYNSF